MSTAIDGTTASAAPAPSPKDVQQLAKLKTVAKQFEAIFVQELFKGLEKDPADGEDDLFGNSQASQTFDQLHHQALSERAAGGLGIAELLTKELAAKMAVK